MLNISRIKWIYEHFGVVCALKSIGYDLITILAYMGYCLTLPFRFLWMLFRGCKKGKL